MLQRRGRGAGDGLGAAGNGFRSEVIQGRARSFKSCVLQDWGCKSRAWGDASRTSEPLGPTGVSVVYRVEDEFHTCGNAELLEYPKKIFLDGVFAQIEFAGDVAVAQSFSNRERRPAPLGG